MLLHEFLTKHLPPDWTKRSCSTGIKFANEHGGRPVEEILNECLTSFEGTRYIRVVAVWIFGDRARNAMYLAEKEALKRPWTWDTVSVWDQAFIDDITAPCVELLRTLL